MNLFHIISGDQVATNVTSSSSSEQSPTAHPQPFKAPPSVIVSKKRKERPRRQESPEKQEAGHSRKKASVTNNTGAGLDYRKSFGGKSEKFTRFVPPLLEFK